eukprot:476530_1
MSSKARRRKSNKSKKQKDKQTRPTHKKPSTQRKKKQTRKPNSAPLIPLPLIFRLVIASAFLTAIYVFKQYYYMTAIPSSPAGVPVRVPTAQESVDEDTDWNSIVNSVDITSRFDELPQPTIPNLKLWKISN